VILVEEIVRSIYWFHPAVWWLLGRIHLTREQSVDHEVVRLTGSRQPYLDSLLEIARSRGRPRAVPAPLFLRERHLMQRVALLIKEASMNRLRLAVSLAGIAVLLAGTVRLAAGWFPLTGEAQIVQQQPVIPKDLRHVPDSVGISRPTAPAPKIEVAANRPVAPAPENPAKSDVPESREQTPDNAQAAPTTREPIKVGGNVQESKLIRRVEPMYPEQAKAARVSGQVILVVTVNEQGFVSDVRVASGHPLLTEAAIAAVKQWQYSPTLLNGEPVPVIFTVRLMFNLAGSADLAVPGANDSPFSRMEQYFISSSSDVFCIRVPAVPGSQTRSDTFKTISPTTPYEGRQYYAVAGDISAPELALNQDRLRALAASGTSGGTKTPFVYFVFISETGRIVGLRRLQAQSLSGTDGSPDSSLEIENELARTQVISPGRRGPEPVPVWLPVIIERP
jgi:TonB family protein